MRIILLAIAAALALPSGAAAAPRTVTLSGTAYEFNNVKVLLGGAQVRVAEDPALRATVAPNGTYRLRVPASATVTPYIDKPGYHRIYLQTFKPAGANLVNVNFQVPTDAVYQALASLLSVPLDASGDPAQCAIVSTFSTRNVRGVPFADFIAYGAHGVAGASASGTPTLPAPVYFNEHVIPDPNQKDSSRDGGVVWTNVSAGVYTIRASAPGTRFASFVATCAPGRIINANPPWGLHELGLANRVAVRARWNRARLTTLTLRNLPPRARVSAAGRRITVARGAVSVDVAAQLPGAARRIGVGGSFVVQVTAPAHDGVELRWAARGRRTPVLSRRCIPLGDTTPVRCARGARSGS